MDDFLEWFSSNWKKVIYSAVGFVVITLGNPVVCVGTGERGAVKVNGAMTDRILGEGPHIVMPFVTMVQKVNVQQHLAEIESEAPSHDSQKIHTIVTLTFHANPDRVNKLIQEVGGETERKIVYPALYETMKSVTARYTASELIEKRDEVSDKIEAELKIKLEKYLIVDMVSMKDFDFTEAYTKAIELKQVAEQEALMAKNILTKTETEAKTKIAEARGDAEALRLKAQQLTPLMVEMERIKKWDGKYPTTMLGQNTSAIIGK